MPRRGSRVSAHGQRGGGGRHQEIDVLKAQAGSNLVRQLISNRIRKPGLEGLIVESRPDQDALQHFFPDARYTHQKSGSSGPHVRREGINTFVEGEPTSDLGRMKNGRGSITQMCQGQVR